MQGSTHHSHHSGQGISSLSTIQGDASNPQAIESNLIEQVRKLSTAVHMVTRVSSDHNDDLLSDLRNHTLKLLDITIDFIHIYSNQQQLAGEYLRVSTHIQEKLIMTRDIGLISEMNYALIYDRYHALHLYTEGLSSQYSIEQITSSVQDKNTENKGRHAYKGQNIPIKDMSFIKDTNENNIDRTTRYEQKNNATNRYNNNESISENTRVLNCYRKDGLDEKQQNPDRNKQNNTALRRENILKILKQKKDAHIDDIASLFDSVGRKTIQRDLNYLIKSGKATKKGEKRWSLYNLA